MTSALLWGALRLVSGAAVGLGFGLLCLGLPWFYWPDESARFVESEDLILATASGFAALCGLGFWVRPLSHWWQLWALLGGGVVAGGIVGARLGDRLDPGGEVAGIPEDAVLFIVYGLSGALLGFICFLLSVRPEEAREDFRPAPPPPPEPQFEPAAAAAVTDTVEELQEKLVELRGKLTSEEEANELPTIDDLTVGGRRVLVRCDLNVPIEDGAIADDMRIRSSVPTLDALLARGARVAVCSHLGRPKGKVIEELRLAPVGERLSQLLAHDVVVLDEIVGDEATQACKSDAAVVLLENLRFDPREEANDPEFASALAGLADAFVNDAFGSSHRAHASVVGVAKRLPAAAGLLLADEVAKLSRLLDSPERPFVAVIGGAKVSDKLDVIEHLLDRVDALVIGGAMAFTLLTAQGHDVGRSLVEDDRIAEVGVVMGKAEEAGVEIHLPDDVVAAESPGEGADHDTVELAAIGDRMGVDIGSQTSRRFAEVIRDAKTVLWNGPMGIFEVDDFAAGTRAVAQAVADATDNGAYSVVGGGDSAAALRELGMTDAVSHLSTGGGASLEFLEGKDLPGIAMLRKKAKGSSE
jgi:phosphoglycerate kinase